MTEPNPADVLAPCPFCGGDVTIENRGDGDLFVILCEEGSPCIGSGFANFGMRSKKAQAIAAWNTRAGQQAQPTPDALREENERLCEAALEAVQRLAHTPMELCITAWSDISRPILEVIRRLPTQSDALAIARDALDGMVRYSGLRESWQDDNPQYVEAARDAIGIIDAALQEQSK